MKKNWILICLLGLLAAFFASTQVMASPAVFDGPRPGRTGPQICTPTPIATSDPSAATTATPQGGGQEFPPCGPQGSPHIEPNGAPKGDPNSGPASIGPDGKPGERYGWFRGDNYRGTISAVSATSLTITTDDNTSVTFTLTTQTHYRLPTPGHDIDSSYTASNLQTGMRVAVHAFKDQTNALIAWGVLVVPSRPQIMHKIGVVTGYTAGSSITIKGWDGVSTTFTLTSSTPILPADKAATLAVGSYVTIIAPRGGTSANSVVIIPAEE